MTMSSYDVTDRTRVRRIPERASYDREVVHAILDEAIVCHVGVVVDGLPRVIPTALLRIDEAVYIHGSANSQLLKSLAEGASACITVSHVDAIVASRSGFNCAVDYRAVVIFGSATVVEEEAEKERVLNALIQHLVPGHVTRAAKAKELGATMMLRFPLVEVSAKVRSAGVKEFEEDYELDLWAGVIPLRQQAGAPKDCPRLKPGIQTPAYAARVRN